MKSLSIIIAFALLICTLSSCPTLDYKLNFFDISNFTGNWYEIIRSKHIPYEDGECNAAYFYNPQKGSFNYSIIDNDGSDNGLATQKDNQFQFNIHFDDWTKDIYTGQWNIIDTDYKNYALIYSCINIFFTNLEYVWVLSRDTSFVNQTIENNILNKIYTELKFKKSDLHFTNQTNCARNMTALHNITMILNETALHNPTANN